MHIFGDCGIPKNLVCSYNLTMHRRTTIEVDDVLLSQVQDVLGTRGLKDTVEKAFQEVVRRHLRKRLADRIVSGAGVDRSPQLLDESRPRR